MRRTTATTMLFFKKLRRLSKHKKLCEEWALANSCESVGPSTSSAGSGSCSTTSASTSASASASSSRTGPDSDTDTAPETTFVVKYLGSTLVESPSSEKETAEAIKTVISMAKASGKKLQRVSLAVSLRGIRMTDLATEEDQLRVSIYRISYCSADARHDHVFAFIATNLNETMECHAYLCPKRKVAQTVTLTVAQAFNTAYELWQLSQLDSKIYHAEDKSPKLTDDKKEADKKCTKGDHSRTKVSPEQKSGSQKNLLIDVPKEPIVKATVESWVSFDEDTSGVGGGGGEGGGVGDCNVIAEDEGIPLKPLKSPTSPVLPAGSHDNNNSIVATPTMTPTTATTTTMVALVNGNSDDDRAGQERDKQQQRQQLQQSKIHQNAWEVAEPRALDLVCSS